MFFHRHPSGWRMFPDMPLPVSSNCATAPWLPEEAVGDFVTPFVLESCLIIHVSVELAGSYLGHVPCKFWKVCLGLKYLPQINYGGKLTCFGCSPRIGYHWFVYCLLRVLLFAGLRVSAIVGSQQQWYGCSYEKSLWSYRARWRCRYFTGNYDGRIAGCHYVDFCWTNAHLLSSSGAR